jgi:predicted metal-dependent hydrolase
MPDAAHDIIPRDIHFELVEQADFAWSDGDPLQTAIVDGFAVMLPEGERFFIRSLHHYLDRIEDPALREAIRGYARQEAFHTREHEAYNAALRKLGHDVDAMETTASALLAKAGSPLRRLLVTCAIEQLTYAFARFNLSRPTLFADSRPAYRRLWLWHSLEELEHSSVALDVLRGVTPGMPGWKRYLLRTAVMNVVLIRFIGLARRNIRALAERSGAPTGWRGWWRVLVLFLVRPGFLRGLLPSILAYYRPGYGARAAGDTGLVEQGRARIAAELGPAAAGLRA